MNQHVHFGVIITAEGREALMQEIHERELRLRREQRLNSDKAARHCGCTAGGMSIEDDATRAHNQQRRKIDLLRSKLSHATIAPIPQSCSILAIGLVGSFMYRATAIKKIVCEFHIVGHNEGSCDSVPRKISHETPIAQAFLGLSKGDSEFIMFEGKTRTVWLTNIRRPK